MAVDWKDGDHVVVTPIGNSLISKSPLFSFDSKYLFVVSDKHVLIYSTTTGECCSQLDAKGEIVSIVINPRNHLQLVTCTKQSEESKRTNLVFWDYTDGIAGKTYQINDTVDHLWIPNENGMTYYLANSKLMQYGNLFDEQSGKKKLKTIFKKVDSGKQVAVALNDSFLARFNKEGIVVYLTNEEKYTGKTIFTKKMEFTCICAHPSDYCIATGNAVGKIFVWYNINTNDFIKTSLHWHQLAVARICFNESGSELMSGGGECVLVKWNLNGNTKNFLPRMGMPICDLVSSRHDGMIATCHVDNAIHLVNNHNKLVKVIQGLTHGFQWKQLEWRPNPIGLIYHSKTSSLILNGKPGHIQFYSLKYDKQLFNLDITYQNYRHEERDFNLSFTEVWRAACDQSGTWLVTLEFRDDTDVQTDLEMKLKFWKYRADVQNYQLNTTVELPHTLKVNTLKFAPRIDWQMSPLCVTTSDDKRFKLWTLTESPCQSESNDKEASKEEENKCNWKCDSVGYYRQVEAGAAGFNQDGTVLAVVFNHALTLWNPETNALKGTLYDPFSKLKVRQIEFGNKQHSQILISATEKTIVSWNLVTSTVDARLETSNAHITKDPFNYFMVFFSGNETMNVFKPDTLEIVYTKNLHHHVKGKKIISSIFVPRREKMQSKNDSQENEGQDLKVNEWEAESQLYFMDQDLNLYTLNDVRNQEKVGDKLKIHTNLPVTPMAALLNQKLKRQSFKINKQQDEITCDIVDELFWSASNMIPSPRVQCLLLHENLYLRRNKHVDSDVEISSNMSAQIKDKKKVLKINEDEERKMNGSMRRDKMSTNFDWLEKLFIKL